MRILSLTEFRAMPEYTIFKQAREPFAFDDWCIKGETWETDFLSAQLDWPENDGSEALFAAYDDMWEDSAASHPLALSYGRDGLFDKDAKFMVLEASDLLVWREVIDKAIDAASRPTPEHKEE